MRALVPPLAVGVLLLILLELSARVFLFGLAGLSPRRVDSVRPIFETGFLRVSDEPELGFEFAPSLDVWFKLVPLRTNAAGLRDRHYEREKPPGTFRVAVLGSSFALPAGVAIEDAFHSLLEERLSAEDPDLDYEFLNFAVGTYIPAQMLSVLRLRALAYDPDVILFCVTDYSSKIVVEGAWKQPPPEWDLTRRGRPFFSSFLVELIRLRAGITDEPAAPAAKGEADLDAPRVIEKLAEIGRETQIPIVVTRLELDPGLPSHMDRRLERQSLRRGLYYFDTRASFAGEPPAAFWIYELDPHPNARAHRIFADALGTFLRAERLLGTPAAR